MVLGRVVNRFLRRVGYRLVPVEGPKDTRVVIDAHYRGHRFRCFEGDPIANALLTGRGWDLQLEEILSGLEPEAGAHVIEVGANIGASFIPIASDFPQLNFHCIEPVPDFFELLQQNAEAFETENVKIYPSAIGSRDGDEVEIHVGYGTAGLSALVYHHADMGTLRVPSQSLDSFVADRRVALIKIDVDGHELNVLRGATEVLRRDQPLIFMEYSPVYMRDVGVEPRELRDLAEAAGYDRSRAWTHDGLLLAEDVSWQELEELAARTPQYLDVMLLAGPREGGSS